jgi:RNA polymerase sigma factor (sigma-70 family)
MATTLRAFLMARTKANEWTISVHRDLEDLLAAWQQRSSPDGAVGVLHLGFDRPPAREFEGIATRFPGRMLLTAAAKYALPSGFQASREPVGLVADLPVHLGTRGWGYLIDDDVAEAAGANGTSSRSFEGWVREFVEETPGLSEELSQAKIYNEADYLANEVSLPSSVRKKIGTYRFRKLINNASEDPCAIALAAPPWLAVRAIETINLTVRVANVFANHGIGTVSDLAKWSTPKLLGLPNFGRTSVRDLCESLELALREGPADTESRTKNEEEEQLNLLASIRRSLLKFPDRERDIVLRRMGFLGRSETLQQIADDYGVTRERVRQIESKATQKLVRESVWDDILKNKLQAQLRNRDYPLPLKGIEAADAWFEGVGEFPDALHYILDNLCQSDVGVVTIDGVDYFAQMNQSRWEAALMEARRLLESGVGKGWSESNCRSMVGNLLAEKSREFRPVLWEKAAALCHFTSEGADRAVLTSYGRGVDHIVEAVLTESDEPLHYSTISALATDRAGRSVDMRRAHNAAASVGHLLGRGIYGVDRHLPKPEVLQRVSDEAEDIVASGPPGRQWHASEILSALVERDSSDFSGESINKYIVDIALRKSGDLKRLGRMIWKEVDISDDVSRIDVRQAIISLLQQAGRPLQTDEIRQRLIALRGVNEHFQIATVDPVLRVGVGLWGLNDRDISIKRPNQPRLLDGLVTILNDRGIGIHVSELERSNLMSVSGLSAQSLFSLACGDSRLKVNSGQYLYLEEWGGPRRESMSEAVAAVLTSSTPPLALEDILLQVEKRMRRVCDRRSLINCLRALEAEMDPLTEAWSFNLQIAPVEEDLALSA